MVGFVTAFYLFIALSFDFSSCNGEFSVVFVQLCHCTGGGMGTQRLLGPGWVLHYPSGYYFNCVWIGGICKDFCYSQPYVTQRNAENGNLCCDPVVQRCGMMHDQ